MSKTITAPCITVLTGTPWEEYKLNGVPVYVKREDLSSPWPGPSFSKIRGLKAWIDAQPLDAPIGVLDTFHSHGGWGISYLCNATGRQCYDFYPKYKTDTGLRPQQEHAQALGAQLIPLQAGRSAILYHQAKKELARITWDVGIMVPNALKVEQSVDETAAEVIDYTPDGLLDGTWVVSISSGTIAAGVLKAVAAFGVDFIAHMGYSRSVASASSYIRHKAGVDYPIWMVDEGYQYKDSVPNANIPFPCNPYYDAKAWRWLERNIHTIMRQPIIFWNIGA